MDKETRAKEILIAINKAYQEQFSPINLGELSVWARLVRRTIRYGIPTTGGTIPNRSITLTELDESLRLMQRNGVNAGPLIENNYEELDRLESELETLDGV